MQWDGNYLNRTSKIQNLTDAVPYGMDYKAVFCIFMASIVIARLIKANDVLY